MRNNRERLNFEKAKFPAIITVISFISFVGAYWLITYKSITPYYVKGLWFVIPFMIFSVITLLTARGILHKRASLAITGILVVVLGIGFFYSLMSISFKMATTDIKEIEKYERVLRLTGDSLTTHFPDQIPNDAKDINFLYQPGFMQGGEVLELSFIIDSDVIQDYKGNFLEQAKWTGKIDDASAKEYEFLTWGEPEKLSEDFTVFIFSSKPYKSKDWNHGEYSLCLLNDKSNEIIFLMEDW